MRYRESCDGVLGAPPEGFRRHMADYQEVAIRATNVEAANTNLARVELNFTGLELPDGLHANGIVTVHIRDDGMVLGKVHDHPITIKAWFDDDEPVTGDPNIHAFTDAAQHVLRTMDRRGIWQDSRMYALYSVLNESVRAARAANRLYEKRFLTFEEHLSKHYPPVPEGEGVAPKEPRVEHAGAIAPPREGEKS